MKEEEVKRLKREKLARDKLEQVCAYLITRNVCSPFHRNGLSGCFFGKRDLLNAKNGYRKPCRQRRRELVLGDQDGVQ